ncbi:MAG: hypothetical protein RLZZ543_172 [Bacteroidota bacterium]|jgi:hypothetical protein
MKTIALFTIVLSVFNVQLLNSQSEVEYAFSYPGIIPAAELQISNPSADQLDPNKIHLVILGDGYHVYDVEGTVGDEVYNTTLFSSTGTPLPIINRFFNKSTEDGYLGRITDYSSVSLPNNAQGDAEDVLDYIFGYDGTGIRPGSANGNYSGFSPFKEYKHFFNTYRVLFNSENSPADMNNGIGHPKYTNNNLTITCEPGTTPSSVLAPTSSYQSYWESEFDFCDSHAALRCNYSKVQTFVNTYFPNVPVFVIVLANSGTPISTESTYGGAANISKKVCVMSARYQIGPGSSYYNLEDRGTLHEFAHIFGRLQDEYWFNFNSSLPCFSTLTQPGQTVTEALANFHNAPNRTDNTLTFNDQNHKWHHWNRNDLSLTFNEMYRIGESEIGFLPHLPLSNVCNYCDVTTNSNCYINTPQNYYKPTHSGNCIMENVVDARPFCAVCREALIMRIYEEVTPINSFSPDNNGDLEYNLSSSQNYELNLTIPVRSDLGTGNEYKSMEVKWEILNSNGEVEYFISVNNPDEVNLETGEFIYKLTSSEAICDLFNGLEAGSYKIKATIHDRAGMSDNLADNTRWVRHPQAEHNWEVIWNVHYSGIAGIDLYSSDSDLDLGSEPSYVAPVNWESNDIWVTNSTNPDGLVHENPVYSTTASPYVHTWVKNRGCKVFDPAVDNANVKMYWSKATTMLDWPTSWDGSTTFSGGSNPVTGNLINTVSLNDVVDIASPSGVKVDFTWANFPDPTTYNFFGVNDMLHFCLLSRIESTFDPMTNEVAGNTYFNVRNNNNIVQKNITVIDDDIIGGSTGDGFTDDRVTGAAVLVSNSSASSQTVKFRFQVPNEETGKPITEEAQVRIILSDTLWQRWIRGGSQGSGVSVYNASRHQIRLTSDDASLSNIQIDTAEFEPLYVSVNFLTQERSTKELFTLRVLNTLEDSSSTVLGGETYLIKPDPYRVNFSADAGNDKELLVGSAWNQNAKTLTETAIYNWYNSSGTKIHSGAILSDTTSTVSSETYTLEVIAQSDGYKDYDEVTITSKLGKINSIVPNPINSGTFTIDYSVSTSASSPKIKVLNINTGAFTEHTISTGNGTLSLAISGYVAGSYSVILICSSQNADDELLIIQ